MKNGSIYDDLYEKMGEVDRKKAIRMFNTMAEYIDFYKQWIRVCSSINQAQENQNTELMKRWRA